MSSAAPCLSSAANQLFRGLTEPARPNLVTGILIDLPRGGAKLLAEYALLRQQLIVLGRRTQKPRLRRGERLSLVFLAHCVSNWKQILPIIWPGTLRHWHRDGFQAVLEFETARASADAAQRLAPETIALIEPMARENPL